MGFVWVVSKNCHVKGIRGKIIDFRGRARQIGFSVVSMNGRVCFEDDVKCAVPTWRVVVPLSNVIVKREG